MPWRQHNSQLIKIAFFCGLGFSTFSQSSGIESSKIIRPRVAQNKSTQINVMAPLTKIQNWDAFRNQLRTLKNSGVDALTTDIWWGHFEAQGDNIFNWSYYLHYAQVVQEAGLLWIPILSFHQCGGNVGDDCNVPLPAWVWQLAPTKEMKFKDENGFVNSEYVSHFFEPIYKQYAEAMRSFAENFKAFSQVIPKIYLSLGPAGELRYPSYYGPAGWSYPQRGTLQSYSQSAQRDFRNHILKLHNNDLSAINRSWGTQLTQASQISPPQDGHRFFESGYLSNYGHDYLSWYQGKLLNHLYQMVRMARESFQADMPHLRLGAKIAGIHWLYNSPNTPHAAEYAAGYYNYEEILSFMKALDVDLTFTCLEMDDFNKWNTPYYSAPQSLVEHISSLASRLQLSLNGENAIAIQNNPHSYNNIARTLHRYSYKSFTLLRMQNIVNEWGAPTAEMPIFRDKIIRPFSWK